MKTTNISYMLLGLGLKRESSRELINNRVEWWNIISKELKENSIGYAEKERKEYLNNRNNIKTISEIEKFILYGGKVKVALRKELIEENNNSYPYGDTYIDVSRQTLFEPKIIRDLIKTFNGEGRYSKESIDVRLQ